GTAWAAVCVEAIEAGRREAIVSLLNSSGHDVVALTFDQMHSFAGNMLELRTRDNGYAIAMSQAAFDSLTDEQRTRLASHARLVVVPIPTIERLGGGSVRCMIAEIHLPRRRA